MFLEISDLLRFPTVSHTRVNSNRVLPAMHNKRSTAGFQTVSYKPHKGNDGLCVPWHFHFVPSGVVKMCYCSTLSALKTHEHNLIHDNKIFSKYNNVDEGQK